MKLQTGLGSEADHFVGLNDILVYTHQVSKSFYGRALTGERRSFEIYKERIDETYFTPELMWNLNQR